MGGYVCMRVSICGWVCVGEHVCMCGYVCMRVSMCGWVCVHEGEHVWVGMCA